MQQHAQHDNMPTCSKLPLNPKCLKVAQIYAELCDDGSEVKIDVLRQTKGSH